MAPDRQTYPQSLVVQLVEVLIADYWDRCNDLDSIESAKGTFYGRNVRSRSSLDRRLFRKERQVVHWNYKCQFNFQNIGVIPIRIVMNE